MCVFFKADFNLGEDDFKNNAVDIETDLFYIPPLTESYRNYYDMITKIILIQYETSDADDETLFEKVLVSLKSDQKLQPLLPFLVNFLSKTVNQLKHSIKIYSDPFANNHYLKYEFTICFS